MRTAILLGFILVAGVSCKKDDIDLDKISNTVSWNPKVAVPVGYGDFSVKDFYEAEDDSSGLIKEYPDNMLYLAYRTQLLSKVAEQIILIPNQSIQEIILAGDAGFPVFGASNTISYTRNSSYSFAFVNHEEMDSMYIKAGTLLLNLSSTFHNTGNIRLTMPSLKRNGVPLQIDINITSSTGTFTYNAPRDLSGYKLYFPKTTADPNAIPLVYEATLNKSGTSVTSTDKITVNTQILQFKFQQIFGYISTYNFINYSDKIEMDLFNVDKAAVIDFSDPHVNIYIKNSCGVPFQFSITNTRTYNEPTNSYFPVNLTPNTKMIRYPTYNEIGKTKYDTLAYNNATSNFKAALQTTPKYLYYSIAALSNPPALGKQKNFLQDTSKIGVDLEIELPFNLRSKRLAIIDSMDFDLSGIVNDYAILKKLILHNKFENGLPFDLSYQLFLTDENYNIIDSVFRVNQQPILPSGVVGSDGKVTSSSNKELQIEFTGDRILNFKRVKKAIYKLTLNTYNDGQTYVKFYSTDRLKVWFGVQADLEVHSLDQI
ncbi:MAG TPA: hypothetical protein VHO72_04735 [Bacteroidales bacterium]|nr:hypothetical protein [Bacteroidales bacterium]